jgi:hypothetical protein
LRRRNLAKTFVQPPHKIISQEIGAVLNDQARPAEMKLNGHMSVIDGALRSASIAIHFWGGEK